MLELIRTVPVFRSFDERKAREFYVDFLGFSVDWEHRFDADLPLFMQVRLGDIVIWLSEHHGDASPGAKVTFEVRGLRDYHTTLLAKQYRYARPGIEPFVAGGIEVALTDPFSNRLSFVERDP